jgi:hypothetical protein
MIRLTLTTAVTLALLLCGGAPRMLASGSTPITIKDGGSILVRLGGLDTGKTWNIGGAELRHLNAKGVLSGLQITESGADRCAGDPKCGIDPAKPWKIQVVYNARWVTIASVSANKGVHVRFSPKILFTQWNKTANADEREFGHGDGRHISSVKVNGGPSLCAGKGGCEITLTYSTP